MRTNNTSDSLRFHVSAMDTLNGHKLTAHEPDSEGFFTVVVGCYGVPTRANVIYDPESLVASMTDSTSRFNICLKDGNLAGEYGHPVIESDKDINRLFRIDEKYMSHYFKSVWTGDPITINGMEAVPIMAKVKPYGPYGDVLEKSLRDPSHNTAFSIRSLCLPMKGPKPEYEYRKVQVVITYDAVSAPGYEIASKRYVSGTESFEQTVPINELKKMQGAKGMESLLINESDIARLTHSCPISYNGHTEGSTLYAKNSYLGADNQLHSAASLVYRRRG